MTARSRHPKRGLYLEVIPFWHLILKAQPGWRGGSGPVLAPYLRSYSLPGEVSLFGDNSKASPILTRHSP